MTGRFYLRSLPRCDCGRPATHEVLGAFNTRYGHVCDRCGKRRVRELERAYTTPTAPAPKAGSGGVA